MINVTEKRCIGLNCTTLPSFNIINEPPMYCERHATKDMINVIRKECKHEGCIKQPSFNFHIETVGLYCYDHRTSPLMINVLDDRCASCGLFIVRKKGDLCKTYCDLSSPLRQKTKEMQVKKLLQEHNISFIHDKSVTNDCCLKYRPDFIIECTTNDNIYFIVLEVDEFAHKSYDPDCEIVRMHNISHSLGLPTKFLRYNPDHKDFTKEIKEETLIKRLKELMSDVNDDFTAEYLFYPIKK